MTDLMEHNFEANINRQFLCMSNTSQMPWEEIIHRCRSSTDWQQKLLMLTVHDGTVVKYPPSHKYCVTFLKRCIKELEDTRCEIIDEMYEEFSKLLTDKNHSTQETCFKSYKLPNKNIVTIEQSLALISNGTTGLQPWAAGFWLAEWAFENRHILCGRKVLELGSGLGFTGLSICLECEPAVYTFTDHHEQVLKALKSNVERNVNKTCKTDIQESTNTNHSNYDKMCNTKRNTDSHNECTADFASDRGDANSIYWSTEKTDIYVRELDWHTCDLDTINSLGDVDVVLAADVTYDPALHEPCVRVLHQLLSWKPTLEVYVASSIRNEDTMMKFRNELEKRGLQHEEERNPTAQVFYKDNDCPINILKISIDCPNQIPKSYR